MEKEKIILVEIERVEKKTDLLLSNKSYTTLEISRGYTANKERLVTFDHSTQKSDMRKLFNYIEDNDLDFVYLVFTGGETSTIKKIADTVGPLWFVGKVRIRTNSAGRRFLASESFRRAKENEIDLLNELFPGWLEYSFLEKKPDEYELSKRVMKEVLKKES